MESANHNIQLHCPIPKSEYERITIAHGSGGKLTHQLIEKIFKTSFGDLGLQSDHDGAILDSHEDKLIMTTDSFVVRPLFFPGGDIGTLAVYGTVNDLAMCGAQPAYMSIGFIIEEGLPIETLWQIALSVRRAAKKADVKIVTGDTKVVEKGKGDSLYINTAGIGRLDKWPIIAPSKIKPGDSIIINGDIGRHSIAVLSQRESLAFETSIKSDCAPLTEPVLKLLEAGLDIHCLRDLTRGGLATALVEIAQAASLQIRLVENEIPVAEQVKAVCEILGFDPNYLANEGRFVAFLPEAQADQALEILSDISDDYRPALIGEVGGRDNSLVTIRNDSGTERIIEMHTGDQFPRIC